MDIEKWGVVDKIKKTNKVVSRRKNGFRIEQNPKIL